jgi:hypothetical protein
MTTGNWYFSVSALGCNTKVWSGSQYPKLRVADTKGAAFFPTQYFHSNRAKEPSVNWWPIYLSVYLIIQTPSMVQMSTLFLFLKKQLWRKWKMGGNVFMIHISDRGLVLKTDKEFLQITNKNWNNPLKRMGRMKLDKLHRRGYMKV